MKGFIAACAVLNLVLCVAFFSLVKAAPDAEFARYQETMPTSCSLVSCGCLGCDCGIGSCGDK